MDVYPGILYEDFYVCPHCIMTNAAEPTTLLLREALQEMPLDVCQVSCENAANDTGEVPAVLHYPRLWSKHTSNHQQSLLPPSHHQ